MVNDSTETNQLIEDAERGDEAAFNQLIQRHRNYLRRIVDLRLEPAMRTRIDPSDVVQEASSRPRSDLRISQTADPHRFGFG